MDATPQLRLELKRAPSGELNNDRAKRIFKTPDGMDRFKRVVIPVLKANNRLKRKGRPYRGRPLRGGRRIIADTAFKRLIEVQDIEALPAGEGRCFICSDVIKPAKVKDHVDNQSCYQKLQAVSSILPDSVPFVRGRLC